MPSSARSLSVKGVCLNGAGEALLCENWRGEWELPGGRPDPGESFVDCLRRELAEETGLSVEVCGAVDASCSFEVLPERWVHVVAYGCRLQGSQEPTTSDEHRAARFFPMAALGDLPLPNPYRRAVAAWSETGGSEALTRALSELSLALELADLADELAMARFRSNELVVEAKSDGSPVTDADITIERALRARLASSRPNHGIVGEEEGGDAGDGWCWYLDPIDGTSRFAEGDPRWYALIGLTRADTVIAGVASAPALGRRWWALREVGSFCNGQRIAVSDARTLAEAAVNDDWRETLAQGVLDRPLSRIARKCPRIRPHEGHSYLAVAEGQGDVAAGVGGAPWDYAAIKLIVEEAGGRFTDLDGQDSFRSGHALVTNGLVHGEALAEVAG